MNIRCPVFNKKCHYEQKAIFARSFTFFKTTHVGGILFISWERDCLFCKQHFTLRHCILLILCHRVSYFSAGWGYLDMALLLGPPGRNELLFLPLSLSVASSLRMLWYYMTGLVCGNLITRKLIEDYRQSRYDIRWNDEGQNLTHDPSFCAAGVSPKTKETNYKKILN